jgi:hypothetical protein
LELGILGGKFGVFLSKMRISAPGAGGRPTQQSAFVAQKVALYEEEAVANGKRFVGTAISCR